MELETDGSQVPPVAVVERPYQPRRVYMSNCKSSTVRPSDATDAKRQKQVYRGQNTRRRAVPRSPRPCGKMRKGMLAW
eukprot:11577795-Heterocapsa_arctica.AAC.1